MNKKLKIIIISLLALIALTFVAGYLKQSNIQVLNPKGGVAHDERNLIIFTVLLVLLVVLPVYVMTFVIAWKYRESNTKAKYRPDWDHNIAVETLWWGIPTAIIVVLSIVAWNTSHSLDPHKPLSGAAPMKIQVVALDWKWLFIYPEQKIASVNYVQFPVGQPVQFELTSNGPMNSLWIPQLGSQIYAMAGMSTHVNLVADSVGNYRGSSSNISGEGFAGMKFTARASSRSDFDSWAAGVRRSSPKLSMEAYKTLARPSQNNPPAYYSLVAPDLYNRILLSFTVPGAENR